MTVDFLEAKVCSWLKGLTSMIKQTKNQLLTIFYDPFLLQAFVAIGDYNGHVGLGVKCSKEVATAIRGAIILAKLSIVPVRRGYWGNKIGKPHTVPCKVREIVLILLLEWETWQEFTLSKIFVSREVRIYSDFESPPKNSVKPMPESKQILATLLTFYMTKLVKYRRSSVHCD